MAVMSARSELGISPVLLQAIAQTLTSSALTASSHDTIPSLARDNSNNNSHLVESQQLKGKSKADIMSLNRTSTSGVISHLLQNLNEPVASLITQTGVSSQSAQQLISDDNNSVISQAGLSVLRLSGNNTGPFTGLNSVTNASLKNLTQSSMVISSEEITNFLLKDEPSDDLEPSILRQGSQNLNAVSSVLSALASQHVQESLTRKNNKQIQNVSNSQSQQQNLNCSNDIANSNNSGGGVGETRSQPQIIIYSYVNSSGQEVVIPPSSPQGNDSLVSESEGCSDSQTTYKVLLHSTDDGEDNKRLTFQPNINYTFSSTSTSNVLPVTDSQNIADGMSRPCPVCGDKVSGYHYGIFTCESCKGFFKRTVQNKKTFVCPKASDCTINSLNRKKCPACRFRQCLQMGMKLEAIRQDRTRGGRSSYDGCIAHLKNRMSTLEKKMKRISAGLPLSGDVAEHCLKDGSKSHRNLVAILNHDTHKQTTPNSGAPQIPELLRDIMNLEPLLSDDDLPAESLMEAPFHEQALYSYMMQLAELRLYKLVRWARNLPQFGAISTDDQILLLQNCWSEVIALSLCWRSIDTPNQISISSTHHITAEWAQHLGFEDVVIRLLNIAEKFRKLYMDQFEYVALKVLLLITPDVKGLKEPRKIRDFQDKFTEALLAYTASYYPHMKDKFGQLLLRLPELSRISFMTKDILIKSLPPSLPCGLLVELLKGDNKGETDGSNLNL